MKLRHILLFIGVLLSSSALSQIPSGYYSSADGQKALTLKDKLYGIIKNHKVLGYNSLWQYYPSTYYHIDDPNRVFDMYSNEVRYYNGSSAVSGMNKEHTVPKSWWGGSTSAAPGNDLYNVIPSDQTANSRKSNYPLGIVKDESWSNGVTTVGKGTVNGYSTTFFEPCDQYKGDFARIYFYMAVCYPDLAWDSNNAHAFTAKSNLTLKDWIIPMLLEWSNDDPVDESEIQRNEDVYKVQGNRNPFIDYPVLAQYIWGSKKAEAFYLDGHSANQGEGNDLVASVPKFTIDGGTKDAPKQLPVGTTVTVKGGTDKAVLYVSVNGGEWQQVKPKKGYNSTSQTEYYTAASYDVAINELTSISAYCEQDDRKNSETVTMYYDAVNFDADFILYEGFESIVAGNNTSSSGSSSLWNGNENFPSTTKVYQAGGAIKLGTGSASGSITSRKLDVYGGNLGVSIEVKGWTSIEGSLIVDVTGAESQVVKYNAVMEDEFETVNLIFENVADNPQLTISTSSKRCFIKSVKVTSKTDGNVVDNIGTCAPNVSVSKGIHTLSGQRVTAINMPGIYIVDGKLQLVK